MKVKRILFVCGSIEPGHDGVGDYTRTLAGALQASGIEVRIISVRDRNALNMVHEIQPTRGHEVKVVRLGESLPFKSRRNEYRRVVAEFNPDWISLQYVPYAFSPKGIPYRLVQFLKIKNADIKWHFMIHEAYIGNEKSVKLKLIRALQMRSLRKLNVRLNPTLVQTSNKSYQAQLELIGIESEILGLFGNIPIPKIKRTTKCDRVLRGVYFGVTPPESDFKYFSDGLKRYLEDENNKLELVLCGNLGEEGGKFIRFLHQINTQSLKIIEKGRMDTEELGILFSTMDFGIARVRPQLLGKSGSAIALLEHGIPLWIPLGKSDDKIKDYFDFRVEHIYTDLVKLRDLKENFNSGSRLGEIVSSFTQSLSCF